MNLEMLFEAIQESVRVFHGSPNPDITEFRFDNLRHRTGTPGTLAFTTSAETARIYGKYLYEVEVQGMFGDYLDREDVDKVFEWRFRIESSRDKSRFAPMPDRLEKIANQLRRHIPEGRYEMWENVGLWRDMGWDGAWCFESNTRNLIVGKTAGVRMIERVA